MMGKALLKRDKAPRSKRRHVEKEETEEEEEDDEEEEETEEEEEDDEEEEETEEEEKENERAETSKKKASRSNAGCKRVTSHKVRDLPDQYDEDIFKSGRATRPKNPFFVAKIRAKRRDQLYIPTDFMKDYNLELPSRMIICDSTGRKFETKLKNWKDGRKWLSGGWRSLCRWNLAEIDDRCICEFVKGKGKKDLYLQVQILHERSVSNPNNKHVEEEEDDDDDDDDDEEYEEEENERDGTFKKKVSCSKVERKRAIARKVRDLPDKYGADIFKSGRAAQPKNPYFVANIRAKRRDQLYIPVDVVKDYNLKLPSSMTIRDSAGREFDTKLKNWTDGRMWLIGGWRSLCRWNLVEKDDRCICEFVRGKGKKGLYLQVQVLHEGSISNPNKKYKK